MGLGTQNCILRDHDRNLLGYPDIVTLHEATQLVAILKDEVPFDARLVGKLSCLTSCRQDT